MTAQPRPCILGLIVMAAGAFMSSCTYDPYYSSVTSYGSNGGISSSVFIRTSNSRWAYDPQCRSYFDYTRQCYYDPWLHGYYPRGYRPPIIVGVPHPHGWRPGRSVCPPPVHVRTHTIGNHHNRYHHYKKLNHSWCQNLKFASNSITRTQSPSHWNRSSDSLFNSKSSWSRSSDSKRAQTSPPSRSTSRPSTPPATWNRSSDGIRAQLKLPSRSSSKSSTPQANWSRSSDGKRAQIRPASDSEQSSQRSSGDRQLNPIRDRLPLGRSR
ncbi:MAG: hypothetical protein ACO3SO_08200 [Luteolibacter sp.]